MKEDDNGVKYFMKGHLFQGKEWVPGLAPVPSLPDESNPYLQKEHSYFYN